MYCFNNEYYFTLEQFISGLSFELGSASSDSFVSMLLEDVNAYVFVNRLSTLSKDGDNVTAQKVRGYCQIKLEKVKNSPVPKVALYICDKSGVNSKYMNYKVDSSLLMRDLDYKGALTIESYKTYLEDVGVKFSAQSIEGLMSFDDRLAFLKEDKQADIKLKNTIDWYSARYPEINRKSIIEVANRAQLSKYKKHEEVLKYTKEIIVGFDDKHPSKTRAIKPEIQQPTSSLSSTITHKSEMLEALQGAIHEFWEGETDLDYANKRATNEVVSMWVMENYNFIDITTALYIARIIRPEAYKRKKIDRPTKLM